MERFIDVLEELATTFQAEREDEIPIYLWWPTEENGRRIWKTPLLDALELAELRAMRSDIQEEGD